MSRKENLSSLSDSINTVNRDKTSLFFIRFYIKLYKGTVDVVSFDSQQYPFKLFKRGTIMRILYCFPNLKSVWF